MKVQNKIGTRLTHDVSNGLAEVLIHLGLCEKYSAPIPEKNLSNTRWLAVPIGRNDSGGTVPPQIEAMCSCLSRPFVYRGDNPASFVLVHHQSCDGAHEAAPDFVCREHLANQKNYRKNKPAAPAGVDILAERRRNPELFLVEVNNG